MGRYSTFAEILDKSANRKRGVVRKCDDGHTRSFVLPDGATCGLTNAEFAEAAEKLGAKFADKWKNDGVDQNDKGDVKGKGVAESILRMGDSFNWQAAEVVAEKRREQEKVDKAVAFLLNKEREEQLKQEEADRIAEQADDVLKRAHAEVERLKAEHTANADVLKKRGKGVPSNNANGKADGAVAK